MAHPHISLFTQGISEAFLALILWSIVFKKMVWKPPAQVIVSHPQDTFATRNDAVAQIYMLRPHAIVLSRNSHLGDRASKGS